MIDFGCVGSSFLCEGFLQLWQAGATLHRDARASLVAEHRLQTRRLSSCGSRAQPLRGMWDPPRPGLEPASPALAGRFSTTAPPGKPWISFFNLFILSIYFWLRWVFVAARGLPLVAVRGAYSWLTCSGFSLRWLLLLQSTGSEHPGFSSCGTRAQ